MATLFQVPQYFDANGDPLSGGKLYWYIAGTTTFKDTYVDQAESSPSPNPVILDNEGRVSIGQNGVWLNGSYKLVIKDANDVTLPGSTFDNLNEFDSIDFTGLTASIADLNSTTTSTLTKTSLYTVVLGDRNKTILADATVGAFVINLPSAVTAGNTFRIYLKKIDFSVNAITITPVGVETIEGSPTYVLSDPFDTIELHSDGSNWYAISLEARGRITTETSTVTVTLEDYNHLYLADASGGPIAVNLPLSTVVGTGFKIRVKKIDSSTNAATLTASGAETIDAVPTLSIEAQWDIYEIVSLAGVGWYIEDDFVSELSTALPVDYIGGIKVGQAADPAHDITFNVGECRDFDNTTNMNVGTAITKQIDASWAAGTDQGGYPSVGPSLTPNTWYNLFIIKSSTGIVDAGFDVSFTATYLLASSGYTSYRRVGSVRTAGSSDIKNFLMTNFEGRRDYYWTSPPQDLTVSPISGSFTTVLTVPTGIEVIAKFNITVGTTGADNIKARFFYPGQDPTIDAFLDQYGYAQVAGDSGVDQYDVMELRTNSSATIGYATSLSGTPTLSLVTEGWIDNLSTLP